MLNLDNVEESSIFNYSCTLQELNFCKIVISDVTDYNNIDVVERITKHVTQKIFTIMKVERRMNINYIQKYSSDIIKNQNRSDYYQ